MLRTITRNQLGINLVEVMVVTVISTVLMASILVVFAAGRQTYYTAEAKITTREETRKAFLALSADLRDANIRSFCVDTSAGNGCPGGRAAELVFRQPAPGTFYDPTQANPTITWTGDIAYRWIRGAGNTALTLYRCNPATTAVLSNCRAIATRITTLSFTPRGSTIFSTTPYPSITPAPITQVAFYDGGNNPLFPTDMPVRVDAQLSINPARIVGAAPVPTLTNTTIILLRNPQS